MLVSETRISGCQNQNTEERSGLQPTRTDPGHALEASLTPRATFPPLREDSCHHGRVAVGKPGGKYDESRG